MTGDTSHTYAGHDEGDDRELGICWRWRCSCGARGRWQYQSDSRCPYEHVEHVQRVVTKRANQAWALNRGSRHSKSGRSR